MNEAHVEFVERLGLASRDGVVNGSLVTVDSCAALCKVRALNGDVLDRILTAIGHSKVSFHDAVEADLLPGEVQFRCG